MKHCVIGANSLDRLVKCPGSLKPGYGSLKEYRAKFEGKKDKYVKNRIECNEATNRGNIIDELAKNYIYWSVTGIEKKKFFVKPEHETDPAYTEPAKRYSDHILKLRKRFGKCMLDPSFKMENFIDNLPDCEFSVSANPDVVVRGEDFSGTIVVSDFTTARSYDRNKMFQVVCSAVAIINHHPETKNVICEVFNGVTQEVMLSKFSREELEVYKNDIIIPALQKVRDALSDNTANINEHRCHNSWCSYYCIFRDECPHAQMTCEEEMSYNFVPIQVEFFIDKMTSEDKESYAKLFQ